MATRPASAIDLNLLSVLEVVLEERSVRGAATRLGLTPSAVSHALRRLREQLGDPLVVRTAMGVVPTERAERLAAPLGKALKELRSVLTDEADFDAATVRRGFTLSSADLAQFVLLPALVRSLARTAPGVRLVVRPPRGDLYDSLARGTLDLAFGIFEDAPEGFRYQALFHEDFLCIVRKGHPAARGALSLERYLSLQHISVAPRGSAGSIVDSALARLGHRRTVALVVPHFLVAPHIVAETDLLLMLPARVARHFAQRLPLRLLPPPLPLSGFTIGQLWHDRTHRDPAHRWLRKLIADLPREPAASSRSR